MGKQYNKVVKRKRRQAYLHRKVAAQAAAVKPKTTPVAAKPAKKAPKAEAAPKAPKVPKVKAAAPAAAPAPEPAAPIPAVEGADLMVHLETAPPAPEVVDGGSNPEEAAAETAAPAPASGTQNTGGEAIHEPAPIPGE